MSLHIVGDLQGCLDPLKRLLDRLDYDPLKDELWFAGDLVNRGPESLDTLRYVRSLEGKVVSVLGNHDLHLLAVALGPHKPKKKDTIGAILAAEDRDQLLEWLRWRPLLHFDQARNLTLVHAGIHPHWSLDQARRLAAELEGVLRSDEITPYLAEMYGDKPGHWAELHGGIDRLRVITNCFTRMRFVDRKGRLELKYKGVIGGQPAGLMPWFEHPERNPGEGEVIFGHWAALGLYQGNGVTAVDSGCVWGASLSALTIEGGQRHFTSVECPAPVR